MTLSARRLCAALCCATSLGACDTGERVPAGAPPTIPQFGLATAANMALQSGAVTAMSAVDDRFSRSVPTTIRFAFDSTVLDATARGVLDRQADFMRQFPEVRFSVFGHTDLVGSAAYNLELGRARARAVVAYLATRGIATTRLEALVSRGETQPVVPTAAAEAANRRTVTEVSGFVDDHPLVVDGKYLQIAYRNYVAGSGVPATASEQIGTEGGTTTTSE